MLISYVFGSAVETSESFEEKKTSGSAFTSCKIDFQMFDFLFEK